MSTTTVNTGMDFGIAPSIIFQIGSETYVCIINQQVIKEALLKINHEFLARLRNAFPPGSLANPIIFDPFCYWVKRIGATKPFTYEGITKIPLVRSTEPSTEKISVSLSTANTDSSVFSHLFITHAETGLVGKTNPNIKNLKDFLDISNELDIGATEEMLFAPLFGKIKDGSSFQLYTTIPNKEGVQTGFFNFGLTFLFQVDGIPSSLYGRIDPLVSITSGGG